MPNRLEPPFYFTKLSIENVRAFGERQELKLAGADGRPARWKLLVGDNGVGKTTLLQSLAWMRPRFNPPPDEPGGHEPGASARRPIEPELAAEEDNSVLAALARVGNEAPARFEADLSVGVHLGDHGGDFSRRLSTSFSIERADGRVTGVRADGRVTDGRAGGAAAEEDVEHDVKEPLLLGYGAGRHPTLGAGGDVAGPIESLSEAGLHDAESLLSRLDHWTFKDDPVASVASRQLDSLKKVIAAMLPDVGDPDAIKILGPPGDPSRPGGVRVRTPYGRVPLAQVSLGYRTMCAWIVDLGWRLIEHYPDSPHPLRKPAIVLVDEIDLHLHPRWQRTVRETLARHFPGVQFIATAHSPLMAQSSLDNVAVVRRSGDHAEIVNDPTVIKEWRLDQLITSDLFGLDSARSPTVAKMQVRRAELLEKPKLTPAERDELDRLNEEALAMPTEESHEDNEAMAIIREAADLLRSRKETS